jgi:polysaccharide export outer membrane protein
MLTTIVAVLMVALGAPDGGAPAGDVSQEVGTVSVVPDGYVIGPQDELSIIVYDEPGLTAKYRVDESGFVAFPFITRIAASGLTLSAFQERLRAALLEFIRNPQVRVAIETYRSQSVMVTGAVRAPQKVTITGTSTSLLEALAAAGSFTAEASNEVIVTRRAPSPGDPHATEEVRVNRRDLELGRTSFYLRDGDNVNVPIADKFYMAGEVRNVGTFVLDPGMTVQQAIALAGGLTDRGSDRRITARRLVKGRLIDVNLRLDDKVMPNDVITIPTRFF